MMPAGSPLDAQARTEPKRHAFFRTDASFEAF
jgi:hypothetical protein